MKVLKTGFWALFFIGLVSVCVTFATQNNDLMTLNFMGYTTDTRAKWQIILGAAFIGAILSAVILIIELIVLESKNIVLRRLNKKLERALHKYTEGDPIVRENIVSSQVPTFSDSDV